jgi:hypothetical protein
MRNFSSFLTLPLVLSALGCTPPEPPPPRPPTPKKSAVVTPPVVAEDPQAKQAERTDGLTGGKLVFEDHFDNLDSLLKPPNVEQIRRPRDQPHPLEETWLVKHPGEWTIDNGWLHAHKVANEDERNAGVWLQKPLPDKVRITFKSKSMTAVGDTKCEVFAEEPKHESGYSVIFGGWNNTINTITRRGEHEQKRVVQSEPPKVVPGRVYTWTIVRNDDVVRWYVDGKFMIAYPDSEAVRGHYFGFNNWASDVAFDDVQVFEL